jgi:hypothetical protein
MADAFKPGERVRVCDPDSAFYDRAGVVVEKVVKEETAEKPHRYYWVTLDGDRTKLTFREDKLVTQK